jgi:hypothetical protein
MISVVDYFWFRATLKITDSYRRGMNFANKVMGKLWKSNQSWRKPIII